MLQLTGSLVEERLDQKVDYLVDLHYFSDIPSRGIFGNINRKPRLIQKISCLIIMNCDK